MDPFIMKTVGEEWARDRQQRRQERERERHHTTERSDTGLVGRSLGTWLAERPQAWARTQRQPQQGDQCRA